MKLNRINQAFRKIVQLQLQFRWFFIAAVILLTVIGALGLKSINTISGEEDFIEMTAADKAKKQRFEELFGNNDSIALLVESEDVFQKEVLEMIRSIGNELLEKVPYADSITSIADIDITVGTEDGMEIQNPFRDGIPDSAAELQKAKDFILSRKSIVNKLVSADAKETWIVLSLKAYPEREVWSKTERIDPMFQDGGAAIAVVNQPKYQSSAYTIKAAGLPYTETEEKEVMGREAGKTVLLSFICMIILLIVFAKSIRGTLVPLFATVASIVTVFGFMGHLHISIYTSMASLPVILTMALAVGYSIHLVNSFKHYFYQSGNRREAVIESLENTGWPLFFTVVTTVVSLLSFLTTELRPTRWVGVACASMVFVVYLYVSILIPILMSFGKDAAAGGNKSAASFKKLDDFFESFGKGVIAKRRPILIGFGIVTALCIPALFQLEVNMDSFKFMGLRIPYVRRIYEITQSQLGSYFNYGIMLTFQEQDAVKEPETLKALDELSDTIGSFKLTKKNNGVPKVFSILDVVKELNQTMNEDMPEFYTIPDDAGALAELLFLYELSGGSAARWVDEDFRTVRMSVDVESFDGNEIVSNLHAIRAFCAERFPDAECFLVGPAVQFAEINNKIVIGELTSFIASLGAIAVLMMLVFGSVKMGFIGLIPNLMPLLVIGGIMGYLRIPLDMITMTIMPMLLGIAVDDTIHFTNHAKYVFENRASYALAATETFRSIGKTLAMTTIILSATFLMYLICKIDTLLRLGVLAAVGLLSALAADYLVTPVLIYLTHPFTKAERK